MLFLSRLLLTLVLSALVTSVTLEAGELPGAPASECAAEFHDEKSSGSEQGTADKALPHHHGICHCPAIQAPADIGVAPRFGSLSVPLFARSTPPLDSSAPEPGLRPPNA